MATRQLDPKVLERIAEQHQSGVFFSLKATFDSGTIRLWSGYEDISLPTGNSNANESYLGSGNLITVSTYTESRDLKSDGINIQLAYVTDEIKTIATTESFQNRPIELRMGYMDAGSKDQVAGTFIIFKGRMTNLTINDVQRRNRITRLLADWGLISIVKEEDCVDIAPLNQIKVLSYKDKGLWQLEQKYNIGKKGKTTESE